MRHLDDKTALRLAMDEAPAEERRLVDAHLETCPACAARLAEARRTWSALGADPAAALPDTPLWPGVAGRLDAARTADGGTAVLRPVWKLVLAESVRSPLAYAAALVLALGIGGGHVAGRALLGGGTAGSVAEVAAADEDLLDYTALTGLPDGSLAAGYLTEDLYLTGEDSSQEAER